MEKISIAPSTLLYPSPAVMVSCGDIGGIHDIVTIAWTGTVCSQPPTLYISVRRERYSHRLIEENMEFAVNIADEGLLHALDFCGSVTGKSHDKFAEAGLTMAKAKVISAPLIAECPINIECKVKNILPMGTHDMFIGEILAVEADGDLVKENKADFGGLDLIAYIKNKYYSIGKHLNDQGYSIRENK